MPLPRRIAALPAFVPDEFDDAPPGHGFQMYFRYWQSGSFAPYKKVKVDNRLDRDAKKAEQRQLDSENANTLKELCPLSRSGKDILAGLQRRQNALIDAASDQGLIRHAVSTAPFATGLGNEHPIENGFSFLTPYGLPYLAGSGVKGVLRHAAEQLALEETGIGWDWLDIWWLFGFEGAAGALWEPKSDFGRAFADAGPRLASRGDLPDFIAAVVSDHGDRARYLDAGSGGCAVFLNRLVQDDSFRQSIHYRGALDFWDVFPIPKDDRLVVEIMTPHHTDYYQNGGTPNDAESPVPVPFLAVPAGSRFDFPIVCCTERLPIALREGWRGKLGTAFDRAFDWLGFGAKTSVGYGAMKPSMTVATPLAGQTPGLPPQAEPVASGWIPVTLRYTVRNGMLEATRSGGEKAAAFAPQGAELLTRLPASMQQVLKQGQPQKAEARFEGKTLIGVQPRPA